MNNQTKALLKRKIWTEDTCAAYDPFGLCKIYECFKCKNSVVQIIQDDKIIYQKGDYDSKGKYEEEYLIEFLDYQPSDTEIESYLINHKNNYKITRICDNVVLKYSNEEAKKQIKENEKLYQEAKQSYEKQEKRIKKIKEMETSKPKSLIKRLIKK